MKRRNKILIALLGCVVALCGAGFAWFKTNTETVLAWTVERQFKATLEAQQVDDSRFEILFCGTGSPNFQADRGQPCTAIIAAGKLFVFDSGQGAAQRLQKFQAPLTKLSAVFITHHHSDHITGVNDVLHNSWLFGRQQAVTLYGPPGTQALLDGTLMALDEDLQERSKTIGAEYEQSVDAMGKVVEFEATGYGLVPVYEQDGLKISAFAVEHPSWSHAYGYKVEYRGKTVVISGDTRYSPNLVRHSQDADVLIHEVVNVSMMKTIASVLRDSGSSAVDPDRLAIITSVHTSTDDLAKVATEANVKKLVLTHLIPSIPANSLVEGMFIDGMDDIYDRDIQVARDGTRIVVAE